MYMMSGVQVEYKGYSSATLSSIAVQQQQWIYVGYVAWLSVYKNVYACTQPNVVYVCIPGDGCGVVYSHIFQR